MAFKKLFGGEHQEVEGHDFYEGWVERLWRDNLRTVLLVPGIDDTPEIPIKSSSKGKEILFNVIRQNDDNLRYYFHSGNLICQFTIVSLYEYFMNGLLPMSIISKIESGEDTLQGDIFNAVIAKLRGDDASADSYLNSAQGKASKAEKYKFYMYFQLAECCIQILKKQKKGEEFLLKAESFIEDAAYNYGFLALGWDKWHNNRPMAKELLDRAELIANGYVDFYSLAESWLKLFGNERKSRQLLNRSEEMVDSDDYASGYLSLAECWVKLFGDENKSKALLEKAERIFSIKSEDFYTFRPIRELITLAEQWLILFNDERKAKRVVNSAQSLSEVYYDYAHCAKAMMDLFNDQETSRGLLRRAETLASESRHFEELAEEWKKLFDDDLKANRLIEKAKSISKQDDDDEFSDEDFY